MQFDLPVQAWSAHPLSVLSYERTFLVSKEIELSFVIPVYNGSKSIADVVRNIKELTVNLAAEVILVNDGSDDASEETCNELAEELPDLVHFVHLARNFGEHNAVLAGLHETNGQYVAVLDDDGQNPPQEVLRMYGFDGDQHAHCEGLNSRLDEIQAAILSVKLNTLEDNVQQRRQLATLYQAGLRDLGCTLPEESTDVRHAYHLYVIRCPDRDEFTRRLDQAEIGCSLHYRLPIHLMEAYQFLGYQAGDLPVTETAAGEILSLPIFPELGETGIARIVDVLRN